MARSARDRQRGEAPSLHIQSMLTFQSYCTQVVSVVQKLKNGFRHEGGEPVGDSLLRGWDMQNGVNAESEFDRDGLHDE